MIYTINSSILQYSLNSLLNTYLDQVRKKTYKHVYKNVL